MDLINVKERCPRCFSPDYCPKRHLCGHCKNKVFAYQQVGAAFDHEGPAATLVQKMKYSGQYYLAKGLGAYLAVQFYALQWPLPDIIVPVPISILRQFERGFNQSLLLAEELASYISRPVQQILKRQAGGYSQAGLTRELRQALDPDMFYLKKTAAIQDKVILLIDDVATTGSTLNRCAEALREQCPAAVYALAVCRAIK
jgi:ComF family protein